MQVNVDTINVGNFANKGFFYEHGCVQISCNCKWIKPVDNTANRPTC